MTRVSLVQTADREKGIKRAIDLLGINPVEGKDVLIKPNFNTSDPFPASTHNDTLRHLIIRMKEMGAKTITVGDRSGPEDTADVLKRKGVTTLCKDLGVRLLNFEELSPVGWVRMNPPRSSWKKGFDVARPVLDADCVVTTCCLKTHGFGGVFTMSLKLSVGIVHRRNMSELHFAFRSMRKMIAETNLVYSPSLILLDGLEAFVDGGPVQGKKRRAGIILAGTDRIAIDAVGLAVLKDLGSNDDIMGKRIFQQEQISRAVELGLGVKGPEEIELLSDDVAGEIYAEKLRTVLIKG